MWKINGRLVLFTHKLRKNWDTSLQTWLPQGDWRPPEHILVLFERFRHFSRQLREYFWVYGYQTQPPVYFPQILAMGELYENPEKVHFFILIGSLKCSQLPRKASIPLKNHGNVFRGY